MPDENVAVTPSAQMMQAAEINALAQHFVRLGVTKIRLTGGEPLVRKDVGAIIQSLSQLPVSLTLTTNAVRIGEYISCLKNAGVRSLNVSLDTLDANKFMLLTRRDQFEQVWRNIHLLISEGFHVKVNVVTMSGVNDTEIKDFIAWTKEVPVHVRFIEFMPFSGNKWTSNRVFAWKEILAEAERYYTFVPLAGEANDTAKKYAVPGHAGTFAVISTMSAPFCSSCNRLRLTADGKLKNCLFSNDETDLLAALRKGEDIDGLITGSLAKKHKERGGQFGADIAQLDAGAIQNRSMVAIGG
jgi:cyclic pyranopterin phosphate synthase